MAEDITADLARALAEHSTGRAATDGHSAWGSIVRRVRHRLAQEPETVHALDLASAGAPHDAGQVQELAQVLERSFAADRGFANQVRSLWPAARTELTLDLRQVPGTVHGDVATARDIDVRPTAQERHLPVPRQLPIDVASFTGRDTELAQLDAVANHPDTTGSATVVISAIAGAPGVGKTALAVHWAHRIRARFPDGDLYANLRGFAPTSPAEPGEVLGDFLLALDVPPAKIPAGIEARAALYRSVLSERRMLVVLDNAATMSQVVPLLPSSPTCLVLVTSRNTLSRLVSRNGARQVLLGVLTADEATALLRRIIGPGRVDTEPGVAAELARLCGYLPLALRLVGERVVRRPHVALARLRDELADERRRLDVLDTGADEEDAVVRAAFSWSYQALSPEAARMFRLLGAHPGPEVGVPAAAALAGTSLEQADEQLRTLTDAHLLEEVSGSRFRFHDLLRCYALEQADLDQADTAEAVTQVLSWYLHTADAANRTLEPQRRRIPVDRLTAQVPPLRFANHNEALHWCDTERVNLVEATRLAAQQGQHTTAWQLPVLLWSFFQLRQHWADWITTHRLGIESARRVGDRHGEGWALNSLGNAYRELRRYDRAVECGTQALAIRRELGDRYGQGTSLNNLGRAYCALGRYDEAIAHSRQALAIHRDINDRWNEGIDLNNLGNALRELQRYDEALECWDQALAIQREIGDRFGQGTSLDNLGEVYRSLERWKDAIDHFQAALTIRVEIGHRYGEAVTLTHLGHTLESISLTDGARERWQAARAIFEEVGDPDAAAECARLLENPTPSSGGIPHHGAAGA